MATTIGVNIVCLLRIYISNDCGKDWTGQGIWKICHRAAWGRLSQ